MQTSESLGPAFKFVDFPLDGTTFNRVYLVSGAKFLRYCACSRWEFL